MAVTTTKTNPSNNLPTTLLLPFIITLAILLTLTTNQNITNSLTNKAYLAVGNIAMHEELANNNQSFADGGIGKTLLHVTVGGVSSLAKGGSFLTGAAAAGVRELLSPLSANTNQKSQDAIAQLVGGSIGALTQGSKGVNIGSSIALSAEKNNRQLHQDEIKWIKQHSLEFAKQNNLDPKIAQALLTLGAVGMVDAEGNAYIQKMIHKGLISQKDIQEAQKFIKGHVVKEKATFQDEHRHYGDVLVTPESKTQMMFTVSKEQYFNSDYNPNKDLGGNAQPNTLDVVSLIPGVRVTESALKNTAKAIDKSLTKSIDEALDVKINPLDGTESDYPFRKLNGDETRDVYNDWVGSINTNVAYTKDNAKKISSQRAEYKRAARELMKDEDAAANLDKEYPVRDFEYYKEYYQKQGYYGEELWKKIIQKSKTTNKKFNEQYGSKKK